MTLCVNQSGTWRNIDTQCVNQSGTWRCVATGCVNQSGTWRCFGFYNPGNCPLGSNIEGGYLICKSSSIAWILAPRSAQVLRNWYSRSNAATRAQQVSGCTGWFVPTCGQLQNPGSKCKTYWDWYSTSGNQQYYWSNTEATRSPSSSAYSVSICASFSLRCSKSNNAYIVAFRCVAY